MQLLETSWPQIDKLSRTTPVLIPVAALEQHGGHMPLFTDSLLLGEVVRRVDEASTDRVLITPLMWLGNSEHHLDFPGTMSAAPRVYLDLLKNMVENFLVQGFQRIIILNGHGGNIIPAQQALFEVRQERRTQDELLLLSCTYWTLGTAPTEVHPEIHQDRMGHAGELETSMMLRIRPDLVRDHQNVEPIDFGKAFAPAHRAWITRERSAPGHIGFPNLASAEKGEALFQAFSADVVRLLERVVSWDGSDWDA